MSRFAATCAAQATRPTVFRFALLAAMSLAASLPSAHAAIILEGDVFPLPYYAWTTSTDGYVGITASGTVTVDDGNSFVSNNAYLGYGSGASGFVTISGGGSTWNNQGSLYVGYSGAGMLSIAAGGRVTAVAATYVGWDTGSTGLIDFSGNGATLTTRSLFVSPSQLTGAGTISANGLVSDINLTFDASHPTTQVIALQNSSGTVTINLSQSGVGSLGAGWKGAGTLTIQDGLQVTSASGYLGFGSAATGVATVSGIGSTWTSTGSLYVGNFGSGTLSITNGGSVSVARATYVGWDKNSTGSIDFGASGGTLTTQSLLMSPTQLTGTGTINTRGLVSDVDLTFDASHPRSQSLLFPQANGTVTVNLDMATSTTNNGSLGAGWKTTGSLTVQDGLVVNSLDGYLGYQNGSTGVATVSGGNSAWNNANSLSVGYLGSGTLTIAAGAHVKSGLKSGTITYGSYIGYGAGSSGGVTVDGTNSSWLNLDSLYVGNLGSGALSIANGGRVLVNTGATYVGYGADSTGSIGVGPNGGTLSTASLFASPSQLSGTGRIDARGIVSDIDLTFDSSHLPNQVITLQQPSGTVTINLTQNATGSLGAGWKGTGSLTIQDGRAVASLDGYLGYGNSATGLATVSGAGSTWNSTGSLYIGNLGNGTLAIANRGSVGTSVNSYLGYGNGARGLATVSGTGSTWTSGNLYVGNLGNGTLAITGGGLVSSHGLGSIAYAPGSTGKVTVDGAGSAWTHSGTLCVGGGIMQDTVFSYGGNATLAISNGGNVISGRYDYGYIGVGAGSTGAVTLDGAGSTWTNGYFWVGYLGGAGTLAITRGGTLNTLGGSVGRESGSVGVVTVDGSGSKWEMSNGLALLVGCYGGTGTMAIRNGGSVVGNNMQWGANCIGYDVGSTGVVAVDGTGSNWTNGNTDLYVGYDVQGLGVGGTGTLAVSGGGAVTSRIAGVFPTSLLAIDVGRGSSIVANAVSNYGTIRILAGAGVPTDAAKYSPISAGQWSDKSGVYQPVGGTWDAVNHTFTASSVVPGAAGSAIALNLASVQRALVSDVGAGKSGWGVGASFLAAASETDITFTAVPIGDAILDALKVAAGDGQSVLSGWTFSTTGYAVSPANPLYLSLDVGAAYTSDDFKLWHYDGTAWTNYVPADLTYDGKYASFTVTGLSGYAVTAIPEPGTLALLAAGLLGLLAWAWRKGP